MSTLHQAALSYVRKGYRLIPCHPGQKRPWFKDWHGRALETEDQVNEYWLAHPDDNIAFCPDDLGLAVIDLDPGAQPGGLDLPPTRRVATPRGGEHLHYVGQVRASVGTSSSGLGPHIDTRGIRSYALLPPSRTEEGEYAWSDEREAVALPVEIEARLAARYDTAASLTGERDLPVNVGRARAYLRACVQRGHVAISSRFPGGGGGDNLTYKISAELVRDCGLSEQTAIDLLLEEWYPHCKPNDKPQFVIEKVQHAARYGQNEGGAHAVSSEPFPGLPVREPGIDRAIRPRFNFLSPAEMSELSDPSWILRDILPENSLCLLTATKGSFKSFIALDIASGLSSGMPTCSIQPERQGLAFYGAHEGLNALQRLHRMAWCEYHGVDPNDDIGIYIGPGPFLARDNDFIEFGKSIAEKAAGRPVKLIVIDTYSAAMMGSDENDPSDANRFIFQCRELIAGFPGCSLLVPAHFGKDKSRGTRGTSALEAGFDTLLTLHREDKSKFVSLRVEHHRAAPEPTNAIHLEGRSVAGSLVFLPVDRSAIRQAKLDADPLHPANVAKVLASFGYTGEDHTCTTDVLASLIRPQFEGEHSERYAAEVKKCARDLARLARTGLHSLTFGEGTGRKWCYAPSPAFPSPESP